MPVRMAVEVSGGVNTEVNLWFTRLLLLFFLNLLTPSGIAYILSLRLSNWDDAKVYGINSNERWQTSINAQLFAWFLNGVHQEFWWDYWFHSWHVGNCNWIYSLKLIGILKSSKYRRKYGYSVLISLAFLKVNMDTNRGIFVDNFIPFISETLRNQNKMLFLFLNYKIHWMSLLSCAFLNT